MADLEDLPGRMARCFAVAYLESQGVGPPEISAMELRETARL